MILISLLGLVTIIGIGGLWLLHGQPNAVLTTTITIYSNGKERTLQSADPMFSQITDLIETVFSGISTGLYSVASPQDLTGSPGTAIEILYGQPVLLEHRDLFTATQIPITLDRILIKLKGDHAGWILFGNHSYSETPFVSASTTTTASLSEAVNGEDRRR